MNGVGMPQWLKLNLFGELLRDAFPGTIPFLVGSAAESKEWRDVDVRVMVTPEEYEVFCGEGHRQDRSDEPPSYYHQAHESAICNGRPYGRRRSAITLAFAALGREMTGLPIDFQFDLYDPDELMSQKDGKRLVLGGKVELKKPDTKEPLKAIADLLKEPSGPTQNAARDNLQRLGASGSSAQGAIPTPIECGGVGHAEPPRDAESLSARPSSVSLPSSLDGQSTTSTACDHRGRIRMILDGPAKGDWVAYCLDCEWTSDDSMPPQAAIREAEQHEREVNRV